MAPQHGQAPSRPRSAAASGQLLPHALRGSSPSGVLASAAGRLDALLRGAALAEVQRRHLARSTIWVRCTTASRSWQLVAEHQGIASTPAIGTSRPSSSDRTRSARAASEPVVRHDHQRGLELPRQRGEQVVQPLAVGVVEVAGRLVGQHHDRVDRQRARHRDPLLLAARQLPPADGHAPPPSPTARQQLLAPATAAAASVPPGDEQRHHHVLQRGELPQQVMELEHEPDLPVAQLGQLGLGVWSP